MRRAVPQPIAPEPNQPAILFYLVFVRRGSNEALRNVTFDVPAGTLSAVVGPNGAGKSSLFGLLSGRLDPSAGTAAVSGDVAEVLQSTGVLFLYGLEDFFP